MGQNEMFSIRQMIELTGLSEFTIRGWENRYQAFCPQRSETGRREYTKRDVEKALLLRELLKRGHKISKIATLTNQKLVSLFESFEKKQSDLVSQVNSNSHKNSDVSQTLELMALQKWPELSDFFKRLKYRNTSDIVQKFFLPLIQELTYQVNSNLVSIAQEHVLSSMLKEKIYSCLSEIGNKTKESNLKISKRIRFVLAAPEGDYHEIGLLLAHLLLRSYGCTSLFLGPHTPAQDLSETALRFEASHLLIVSTVSKKEGAKQHILNYVSEIHQKAGPSLKVLLAGSQAPQISSEQNSNLISIASFQQFEDYLMYLTKK